MSEERMRILNMVANGKITPEEAERLLEALNAPPAETSPSAPKNPKFIRVKVTGSDNVDVRVPVGILRAGIKLTALIPPLAMAHIDEHMKEQGLNFDLSHIKKEDIDELIANLGELEVDVKSRNGDTVRVYCE
jgi:hypothetical protein